LTSALTAGEALADFVIPATAGQPAIYSFVNKPPNTYWLWFDDPYVWRTMSPSAPLAWVIPLPFHAPAGHNIKWGAEVMVSGDTECFVSWYPDDVPGSGFMSTASVKRSDAGSLLLTTSASCPTTDCVTSFATAQVSCMVPAGGFVGSVTYWLIDLT
jgi:hypothetical protein